VERTIVHRGTNDRSLVLRFIVNDRSFQVLVSCLQRYPNKTLVPIDITSYDKLCHMTLCQLAY